MNNNTGRASANQGGQRRDAQYDARTRQFDIQRPNGQQQKQTQQYGQQRPNGQQPNQSQQYGQQRPNGQQPNQTRQFNQQRLNGQQPNQSQQYGKQRPNGQQPNQTRQSNQQRPNGQQPNQTRQFNQQRPNGQQPNQTRQTYQQRPNGQPPNQQRPSNRQRQAPPKKAPKQPSKPKYTKEQLEQIRLQRKYLRQQKRDILRRRAKLFFRLLAVRAAAVAVVGSVMFAVFAGLFTLSLYAGCGESESVYTVNIGVEHDRYSTYEISEGLICRDGVWYVDMTKVIDYCGFITTGDVHELRFILKDSGSENVRFTAGSKAAYINGERVSLDAPVFKRGDGFYVPADFFGKYMTGIEVTVDESAKTFLFTRALTVESAQSVALYEALKNDSDSSNDMKASEILIDYENMTFTLREPANSDKIYEYTLDANTLLATDPALLAAAAAEAAAAQAAAEAAAAEAAQAGNN